MDGSVSHDPQSPQFGADSAATHPTQDFAIFHHGGRSLTVPQAARSANSQIAVRMESLFLQFGQNFLGPCSNAGLTSANHHHVAVVVLLSGWGFQCECWHGGWAISF